MAGMESALSDAMLKAGYDLLNPISRSLPVDETLFARVLEAFSDTLPKLADRETP